jgi:hypothetical protein
MLRSRCGRVVSAKVLRILDSQRVESLRISTSTSCHVLGECELENGRRPWPAVQAELSSTRPRACHMGLEVPV